MGIAIFIGGFFLVLFTAVSIGWYKSWYITKPIATMFYPSMVYSALPMGLGFMYLAIMPLLPNYSPDSLYGMVMVGLFLIGVLFMLWPPSFLKPEWLKELHNEYGYCLPILIEEARQMGRWKWDARVRTPKQMQSWIDEVMINRKDDIDELWSQYRRFMREEFGKGNYYIPEHRRPT